MNKKIIYIQGMHCVSCERLLEDEFKNVPGVDQVRADVNKNSVEISYAGIDPSFGELQKIARKFGYEAFENKPTEKNKIKEKSSWPQWVFSILIVAVILVVFNIFEGYGFLDKIDLGGANFSYPVSFFIGLAASISSCLAVVGAVVIAFSEKYKNSDETFWGGAVKPNLFFHIGRLATFFVLGGILGLVGGELNISGSFISTYTIVISLVMAWLGLSILGLLPSLSAVGINMPKKLTRRWGS